MKVFILSLCVVAAVCQDSYLAPLESSGSAQQATGLYSSPDYYAGESVQAASLYNGPNEAFNDVDYQFDLPQTFGYASESVGSSYGSPADSTIDEVYTGYGSPSEPVVSFVSDNSLSGYGDRSGAASSTFVSSAPANSFAQASSGLGLAKNVDSIGLVRSTHVNDNHGNWNYMYEADNGIFQEATGKMKTLGDTEVHVMSGSYSYIGPDGLTYQVDWYADETGYHPSAPHLPKEVEIPYPEIAEAVAAQKRLAEEQTLAAASNNNGVIINLGDYDYSSDLAGYGSDLSGYNN